MDTRRQDSSNHAGGKERKRTIGTAAASSPDGNQRSGSNQPRSDFGPQIQAPSVSLPNGGGSIQGIDEKFSVNPATGTASLKIPIFTPDSRDGFGPDLSLSYDSGGGNGPFGHGFQLGLPSISRKTSKGLPQYGAGDEPDTFVLSGVEDLVPVGDPETRTTDAGETWQVHTYRPRVEENFSRVEFWSHGEDEARSYWRVVSRDNVTRIFGKDRRARIADPEDPSRIYQWLLQEKGGPKGNVIRYGYKQENDAGVSPTAPHEQHRLKGEKSFANRYPKRIQYGNRRQAQAGDWLFEIVFDYGAHADTAPSPQAGSNTAWNPRPDPFSSYRSGFEVRTYRLCERVLVFHHVDHEGEDGTRLVRSTDFQYLKDRKLSQLKSVTQKGYAPTPGDSSTIRSESLPPLEFTYTGEGVVDSDWNTENGTTSPGNNGSVIGTDLQEGEIELGRKVDGDQYRWVDLDGEGISGLLARHDGDWYYRQNQGNGELGPLDDVDRIPSGADLGRSQRLLDLAGDGQIDLAEFSGAGSGFYERRETGGWQSFEFFRSVPNVDWQAPHMRQLDVTGDGRSDLIVSEDRVFTLYASEGEEGFSASDLVAKAVREKDGPDLMFADGTESIHLADMVGDGLTDLVRIRNGEICYWPNLGYGRFGEKVTMDGAPRFAASDAFDPSRLRLSDIDGTGMTDVIYLGAEKIHYWFNQSGNGWSTPEVVEGFPSADTADTVQVTDLLGRGTACLVWSSSRTGGEADRMKYVDLMGGVKPHLLKIVDNNRGRVTTIEYAPSTKFYLQDREDGRPWATKLPFPVQVVEKVVTEEKVTGTRRARRYRYHHGYFDGKEREFRGFGMVEKWDSEDFETFQREGGELDPELDESLHQPPTHVKTWYHTGAYRDGEEIGRTFGEEYYAGDPDAARLPDAKLSESWSTRERREAARALRGKLLRREVYADDGSEREEHPYKVEERSYRLRKLADAEDEHHAVFHPFESQVLAFTYERQPEDPRVHHELTLEVDAFGNPTRSIVIGYPRRSGSPPPVHGSESAQKEQRARYTERDFINEPDLENQGYYRVGMPAERRVYEVNGLPEPTDTVYRGDELRGHLSSAAERPYEEGPDPERSPSEGPTKRLVSCRQIEYWKDDLSGALPIGDVEGRALPRQTYELALTSGLVEDVYGRSDGSSRVAPSLLSGEAGYTKRNGEWWAPSGVRRYDPQGFYQMVEFVDPFGGSYRRTYDAFDLFPSRLEKPALQTQSGGTKRLKTELEYDYRALRPREVTDPNGNREAIRYDPLGMVEARAVMGKKGENEGDTLDQFVGGVPSRVSADPSDPVKFLEALVDNANALLQGATERVFVDLNRYEEGGQPACIYRIRRRTHESNLEDGESTEVERSVTYLDGLGREVMTKEEVAPGPAPKRDSDTGELVRDADGLVTEQTEPRWTGTGRTVFDNKGQPVKQYEPFFSATPQFEEEQELVERGVTPVMRYDPLGRLVRKDFPDGTLRRVEFDAWHKAAFDRNDTVKESDWHTSRTSNTATDAERRSAQLTEAHADTPTLTQYDALGRPYRTVQDDGQNEVPTTRRLDIRGQPLSVTDARGREVMRYRYDLRGQMLRTESLDAGTKHVLPATDGETIRRWSARGHTIEYQYDALRRPTSTQVTEPDGRSFTAERVVYGVDASNPRDRNLLGEAHEQYDGSGVLVLERFDFAGNLREERRTLSDAYEQAPDWSTSPTLEPVTFVEDKSYDAVGRPTERRLWHEASRRQSSESPGGRAFTSRSDPAALERRSYTKAGRIERIEANPRGQGTTPYLGHVAYNERGQRSRIEYGGRGGNALLATRRTYDEETFRLDEIETGRRGDTLQSRGYTYDPTGNVVQVSDQVGQRTFSNNDVAEPGATYEYDPLYRLTVAEGREREDMGAQPRGGDTSAYRTSRSGQSAIQSYTRKFGYDEVGNITSVTHTANSTWTRSYTYEQVSGGTGTTNRLASTEHDQNTWSYDHDSGGNMIRMPHLQRLTWNYADELRSVRKSENQRSYFQYDADGRRVRKVENKEGALVEERIYLGGFEIYRRRRGGSLERRRETLHVGGGNTQSREEGRVALLETKTHHNGSTVDSYQPKVRYQLTDHLKSVTLEVSGAGQVITYEEYYPYGETAFQWGQSKTEAKQKRYRYTGKERDSLSGLYYHGARYYAPWLSRWTNPDPSGLEDGINRYVYVQNRPLNYRDPSGEQSQPKDKSGSREAKQKRDAQNAQKRLRKSLQKIPASSMGGEKIKKRVIEKATSKSAQEKLSNITKGKKPFDVDMIGVSLSAGAGLTGFVGVGVDVGADLIWFMEGKSTGALPSPYVFGGTPYEFGLEASASVSAGVSVVVADFKGDDSELTQKEYEGIFHKFGGEAQLQGGGGGKLSLSVFGSTSGDIKGVEIGGSISGGFGGGVTLQYGEPMYYSDEDIARAAGEGVENVSESVQKGAKEVEEGLEQSRRDIEREWPDTFMEAIRRFRRASQRGM